MNRIANLILLAFLITCFPARRVYAENWPQFRGPTGQGESAEKGLPTEWSATKNVKWKVDVPGFGWSSPCVWEDRIFLTYTDDPGVHCHVICFGREKGEPLWDVEVFQQTPTRKEGRNSYATPTPTTDGQRVYAVFSGGGIACLDNAGKIVWTNIDTKFYSQQGLGASPALYKDLLVMNFDASSTGPDLKIGWLKPWDKSFVLALDKQIGQQRWKTMRGLSRVGHTMPRFVEVSGKIQCISAAGDVVQGLDPDTGEKIWWCANEGETPVPTPVIGDGMVFTGPGFSEHMAIRAIRLGGTGDVTKTNIVWEAKKAVPTMPSYAFTNHMLFTVKEDGIAQCFEASTGKVLWHQRLDGTYSASPVLMDGRLFFLSDEGLTTVINANDKFEKIAESPLNEPCQASMAVTNGQLFIRTKQHLFCIAGKVAS